MGSVTKGMHYPLQVIRKAYILEKYNRSCSFERLLQLLDKELNPDDMLEVLNHLDTCSICRDAIYQISRDRDEAFFIHRPYIEKSVA